jgi:hypothetical protein
LVNGMMPTVLCAPGSRHTMHHLGGRPGCIYKNVRFVNTTGRVRRARIAPTAGHPIQKTPLKSTCETA